MTYDELPQADKDKIQEMLSLARSQAAQIYRNAINAGVTMSLWNGEVSAIVASLDAAEEIPNTTGLAGAAALTKENLADNVMSYLSTTASMGTTGHRDNIVPCAGAINVVG